MLFTGLFLLGLVLLIWKFRNLHLTFAYVFGITMIYGIAVSTYMGNYWFLMPLGAFILFYLVWRLEKRTIWTGILFVAFLGSFFVYLLHLHIYTSHVLFSVLGALGILLLVAFILMGYFGLGAFLLANFAIVRKRESKSLPNMLTLLAGIGVLCLQLMQAVAHLRGMPQLFSELMEVVNGGVAYFFLLFAFYLTASILYNLNPIRTFKKYVVVCGAGLINGRKVSPLLHNRIQAAIDFANSEALKTGELPILIMSGGKGDDELVSEAFAMTEAALTAGFPREHILLEEKSTTTYENLKYCKALIKQREEKPVPMAFSTNNYHLLRTGMFAKELGLKAEGIGAKTALYFLPNAFLREFAAYLMMTRWWHVGILTSLLLLYLSNIILNYYMI